MGPTVLFPSDLSYVAHPSVPMIYFTVSSAQQDLAFPVTEAYCNIGCGGPRAHRSQLSLGQLDIVNGMKFIISMQRYRGSDDIYSMLDMFLRTPCSVT
jgi:hypothetical protein